MSAPRPPLSPQKPRPTPRRAPTRRRLEPYPSAAVVPAVLASVAILIVAMWWHDTTPTSVLGAGQTLTAIGSLLGLIGAYLVLVQLLLLARLPWFEKSVGLDRLAAWHRAIGTNVVITLVLHATLVTVGYALTARSSVLAEPIRILGQFHFVLLAMIALAILVVVAVTSATAARRRLSYEAWYWIHVSVYVAVALAALHQVASGVDFVGHPVNKALWIAMYAVVAGCIAVTRFGRLVVTYLRHRMRVDAVVPEGPDAVSVWVRGRNLHELGTEAGQFFLWRFLVRGHLLSAHPYSVSTVPDRHHLRITIKAAGDHSAGVRSLRPGDRVLAEGPYGHFTLRNRTRLRCLLVAGGAGIAPVRALAEALARNGPARSDEVVLIYRASRAEDLLFRHELDSMARHHVLTVHYLVGRRRDLRVDPLSQEALRSLVPDVRQRDVWVCGPEGMTKEVRLSLLGLGVPMGQVHTERFSLW